jgi:hypothetical protein
MATAAERRGMHSLIRSEAANADRDRRLSPAVVAVTPNRSWVRPGLRSKTAF